METGGTFRIFKIYMISFWIVNLYINLKIPQKGIFQGTRWFERRLMTWNQLIYLSTYFCWNISLYFWTKLFVEISRIAKQSTKNLDNPQENPVSCFIENLFFLQGLHLIETRQKSNQPVVLYKLKNGSNLNYLR